MIDSNAERNRMLPGAQKMAGRKKFPSAKEGETDQKVLILETSKTKDWNDSKKWIKVHTKTNEKVKS